MTGGSAAAAWDSSAGSTTAIDARLMSIGEVLSQLRADFPDVTISKLRFLETEGLVEPRRTPSGYRKYTIRDVARLRYVLTAQRDHYLPLRVIREHLESLDDSAVVGLSAVPSTGTDGPAPAREGNPGDGPDGDIRLSRDDLLRHTGLDDAALRGLEQAGLVTVRTGGGYDADALDAATAAAQLAEYGLEPRHLRAYRAAADREVGLFTQMVAPMARQQGPAGRAKAADTVRELATLTQRLQAAMVRAGLRETLGR
jgi:DNA-binding transcriptional MerR regulator